MFIYSTIISKICPNPYPPKPAKGAFGGFGGTVSGHSEKISLH
jgi:hypothetical protein